MINISDKMAFIKIDLLHRVQELYGFIGLIKIKYCYTICIELNQKR